MRVEQSEYYRRTDYEFLLSIVTIGEKMMSTKKFDPAKVVIKKALTLPVLSMKIPKGADSITIYFSIAAPIHEKEEIDKNGVIKPVHTVPVISLVDERPYTVVLSAVMVGLLIDNYKNLEYIGKSFQATSFGKINGKEYNTIEMVEIEGDERYTEIAKSFGIYEKPDLAKQETKTAASSDAAEETA